MDIDEGGGEKPKPRPKPKKAKDGEEDGPVKKKQKTA